MDIMEQSGTSLASVGFVPHMHVPMLWGKIVSILNEYGQEWLELVDENTVLAGLYTGQMDLWAGMQDGELDGFAVCAWERHPRRSYYHIIQIMGRNLHLYFPSGMKLIEQYACLNGAYEVVIEGRKGWLRKMEPLGYKPRTVRLRKNVRTLWSN
jgi:hypothetical protein